MVRKAIEECLEYMRRDSTATDDLQATKWAIKHWREAKEEIEYARSMLNNTLFTKLVFGDPIRAAMDMLTESVARLRELGNVPGESNLTVAMVREIELRLQPRKTLQATANEPPLRLKAYLTTWAEIMRELDQKNTTKKRKPISDTFSLNATDLSH